MRAQACAFVVLMLLAACTATPIVTSSPSQPAAPSPSGSAPSSRSPGSPTPSVAALPAPSGTPREYTTTEFQPAFTVELPAGWTVAERAPEVAQIYQECQTCAHGGEENGEITFDMTSADMSLDEAVADLLKADNIEASAVDSAHVGTLSGKKFTATRAGPPNFRSSGYHSEPAGLPIDVYVLTVAGKTATVFVDPHEASGSAGQDFMAVAAQILESVRISS
jgi:hypothetical protein